MSGRRPWGVRLYAAALRLVPRSLRREFGAEMLAAFETRYGRARAAHPLATVRTTAAAIVDLLGRARREWTDELAPRRERPSSGPRMLPRAMARDVRHIGRGLVRTPGFTALAVLTIGVGIGIVTAMYSLVHGVVIDPLPYPAPHELMVGWSGTDDRQGTRNHSEPAFLDYRAAPGVFEDFGAIAGTSAHLTGDGEPQRINSALVSSSFLPVLGVQPVLGRNFLEEEDREGGPAVVLLGHGLWTRRFGSDPNILGTTVVVDGTPRTVVGVMPPDHRLALPRTFSVRPPFDLWEPLRATPDRFPRNAQYLLVIGRLRDGASVAAGRREAERITASFRAQHADYAANARRMRLEPLHDDLVGDVRPTLWTLFGAVAFVLLIGCANVASMLLARNLDRTAEVTLRQVLGASRAHVTLVTLAEAVVLGLLGGVVGAVLAAGGLDLLLASLPVDLPRADDISINGAVLLFASGISVVVGLVVGMLPAWRRGTGSLWETLGRAGSGRGAGRAAPHASLIVAEVALAVLLLVGAGLLIKSTALLAGVDPGFRADGVVTFELGLPESRYETPERMLVTVRNVVTGIENLPGVEAVGTTSTIPLASAGMRVGYARGEIDGSAEFRPIAPGYFDALGIDIRSGRAFGWSDDGDAAPVAIVNETLAARVWPGDDPVGRRLEIEAPIRFRPFAMGVVQATVVGMVADVRSRELAAPAIPQIYRPYAQLPQELLQFAVRAGNPTAAIDGIRDVIRGIDPAIPVANVRSLTDYVDDAMSTNRFLMGLLAILAAVAVLLASVGIYGVLSHAVGRRTREIGIRLSLGATPTQVLRFIVRQGVVAAAIGIVVGLGAALGFARLLATMLFGVEPSDPLIYLVAALGLLGVSAAACLVPATRAARVDPVSSMRAE